MALFVFSRTTTTNPIINVSVSMSEPKTECLFELLTVKPFAWFHSSCRGDQKTSSDERVELEGHHDCRYRVLCGLRDYVQRDFQYL